MESTESTVVFENFGSIEGTILAGGRMIILTLKSVKSSQFDLLFNIFKSN